MKCPKCGEVELKEETYGWYKCNYCGNTFLKSAVKDCENCELKAQKEKAESELKAIRDRIEAIKKLPTIENGQFVAECRWNAGYNTAIYDCKEIIKQIGGEK